MYYAANLVSDLRKPHCTDLRRSLSPLGMPPPADAPLKLYQDDGLLDQDAVWKAVDPALEEIVDEITRLVQENPASG